jgi:putative toxin-antitoxin system antitoxin component (TIGR02293 family)
MSEKPAKRDATVEEPAAIYGAALCRDGNGAMSAEDTVARIRAGLPMVEFVALQELLGLGAEALAGHLGISRSTLVRRRKAGKLDRQESDRLLRYARLYGLAEAVLGDSAAARDWLESPARALGYATPLSFAETEAGAREVEALLGRIEYGVFS